MSSANPIIVVTGANGGVGYGICERLLLQLSSRKPSDAQPQPELVSKWGFALQNEAPITDVQGLTLIMACRSKNKAESARTELYNSLNAHIAKQRALPGYDGHADVFRKNLKIEIHYLDLAIIQSVFRFSAELSQKYPYVSHLICNAGVASFTGINWPKAIWQLCTDFVEAVTSPSYFINTVGEITADGLGWVWQCNLFGHYCLFRSLQTLMFASKPSLGARVIWTSSIESSPAFYNPKDWQLISTDYSYAAVKYQIDLLATRLDGLAIQNGSQCSSVRVRHVVVQPGIVGTNISNALVGWFMDFIKLMTWYIARMLNSPNHTIHVYKGAIAAVHLSLISLSFMPAFFSPPPKPTAKGTANGNSYTKRPQPVRFGSQTNKWGTERVGMTPVVDWYENEEESRVLLEKCDDLYQQFWETEGMLPSKS